MEFDREWIEETLNDLDEDSIRFRVLKGVLEHHTPKKKVDLSKLPVDTLVEVRDNNSQEWNVEHYGGLIAGRYSTYVDGRDSSTSATNSRCTWKQLRLIEQPKFTFWHGGACPVPEGVRLEIIFRSGKSTEHDKPLKLHWGNIGDKSDVIAYRIIGLADGWQI